MPKKKYILTNKMQKQSSESLEKVIELAGGVNNLAKILNISRQTIFSWKRGFTTIPIERAIMIEKKFDEKVTIKDLRPDIFID